MWSYKRFVDKDVRGKIDCSFRRRPIPFMAFLFFCFHGIEMLVYSLKFNPDIFELWLVQLVNC